MESSFYDKILPQFPCHHNQQSLEYSVDSSYSLQQCSIRFSKNTELVNSNEPVPLEETDRQDGGTDQGGAEQGKRRMKEREGVGGKERERDPVDCNPKSYKWGSEVATDLPEATLLTGARFGFKPCPNGPRDEGSCIILHCRELFHP